MARDDYEKERVNLADPADYVWSITPSNDADLVRATRAVRCNGAGTVRFVNRRGETCDATFAAGETRAIRAHKIMATGTSATGIEGIA